MACVDLLASQQALSFTSTTFPGVVEVEGTRQQNLDMGMTVEPR